MRLVNYIKTVSHQERPLKFVLSKILIRAGISHFFTIKRNGYRLRFYPSAVSRVLWISNNYENPILSFVHDYLRRGDKMIDAGANIGLVTLEASLIVGQHGKIYSIEAHPKTFGFLKGNIVLNNFTNIESFNIALGEKRGEIIFSNKISDDQNSVANEESGITVPSRSLDDLVDSSVDLLKIDVEGYEKFVLMGSKNLLKTTKCVCFEVFEQAMKRYDYSVDDIYDILLNNNFRLFRMSNEREIVPIARDYRPKTTGEDLLAIKDMDDFLQRTNYKIIANM